MEIVGSYPDAEVLHQIRNGNDPDGVIRHLYRSHFNAAAIYIKQNSGNQEDAEDIFQDTVINFIQLVQKDKFRGDCSIGTFMYTLVRNGWLNELKKKKRSLAREEKYEKEKVTSEMDVSESIVTGEIKKEIVELIESLGETCKKILMAFYYDNLSIQEILASLPYENEQVVRNKKYKCLQKLQETLSLKPQIAKNLKSILSYEP
ncbi:MAG: sigma-70 family RNA polymerase sigma factor [Ginsengibacter sp.]